MRERALTAFAQETYGPSEERVVLIAPGSGPRRVAQQLADANIVRDSDLTYRLIRREKLGPKLQAGEYAFKGPGTPVDVLQKIVRGEVRTYRVTIPEGLRM